MSNAQSTRPQTESIMNEARFGIYWKYNVTGPSGPIKSLGRVFFVMNDYGYLTMVLESRLIISLQ